MTQHIIGIDTGGTFTDGVLIDKASGKVLAKAKTLTTHHNLSLGTAQVLEKILQEAQTSPESIGQIGISTTLATNSVVENRGARVAVFVIGYVKHFRLPVKAVIFVKGGHTITGEEENPLDLDYLVSLLDTLRDEVDAYAVCSAMSFKNPTHELVAEKAITMLDPKPVFCSHRISSQAGMEERAATAGLHAKLMPVMTEYTKGVGQALAHHNLTCPMFIVSGNGQPMESERAITHAGMTVASGPACTALYGSLHANKDALIVDIGGTTTDVALIRDSAPVMAKDGCTVGNWRTQVEAIDMFTQGIGGDSLVAIDERGNLTLGPQRVVPLATSDWKRLPAEWLSKGNGTKCIDLMPASGENTHPLCQLLTSHGPLTLGELGELTGQGTLSLYKQIEQLSHKQRTFETGLTPTDCLHVLGKLQFGDGDRALEGATILGKYLVMTGHEFAQLVVDKTIEAIETCIIRYVTTHFWDTSLTAFLGSRQTNPILGVDFSIKVPLIGIGAAAPFFLPEVAKRLSTTVYFPEEYEVGNAIGAALALL